LIQMQRLGIASRLGKNYGYRFRPVDYGEIRDRR